MAKFKRPNQTRLRETTESFCILRIFLGRNLNLEVKYEIRELFWNMFVNSFLLAKLKRPNQTRLTYSSEYIQVILHIENLGGRNLNLEVRYEIYAFLSYASSYGTMKLVA